jgi:hypothetical protein
LGTPILAQALLGDILKDLQFSDITDYLLPRRSLADNSGFPKGSLGTRVLQVIENSSSGDKD